MGNPSCRECWFSRMMLTCIWKLHLTAAIAGHILKASAYQIVCAKGIRSRVLIDTLDRYPWSTSWSLLDQHPNWYLVSTLSTLDQQSVDGWLSVDQLISIDQKLGHSRPTVDQDVDGASFECQPRCQWSVNWVSIEGWSRVLSEGIDQGYQSTLTRDAFSTHESTARF